MDSFDTVHCNKCDKEYNCSDLIDDYAWAEWYNGKELHSYNTDTEKLICTCGNEIEFYFLTGIEAMTWNDTLEIEFHNGIKENL